MLDIKKILQRSWHILWNYRTLWIFGFILALAIGGNNFGNNSGYRFNNARASGLIRSTGMTFPGNATPVLGSRTMKGVPEKSPVRIAGVGINPGVVDALRLWVH